MNYLWRAALAILASAATLAGVPARADQYPSKPVTLMVGFAAGGTTDLLARVLAREFSEEYKQSFVVANRPGANSGLAMSAVASAAPDGYTLLMVPVGLAVNEHLYEKISYGIKNFEPIGLVAKVPNVIVVNKKLNISTLKGLIEYSMTSPNKIAYAAPAAGSSAHLSGELLRFQTKADLLHVPFNGDAPALMALLGGTVDAAILNLSTASDLIRSGNYNALAVTTAKRSPAFPDIPTVAEAGVPGYEVSSYFGFAAPAGIRPELIEKLNSSLQRALEQPAVKAQLLKLGFLTERTTPNEFRGFLVAENKKWGEVIRASGMKRLTQ